MLDMLLMKIHVQLKALKGNIMVYASASDQVNAKLYAKPSRISI